VPEPLFVADASPDLLRIRDLPRYEWWSDPALPELQARLTALFRTPTGTATLRPAQAAVLSAAFKHEGVLAPLTVGSGKTLISFLLPHIMAFKGYTRPLLIVPAGVSKQTEADYEGTSESKYRDNWRLPPLPRTTYQTLSRKRGWEILQEFAPDHLILDECQMASDASGTVWSKLKHYIALQDKRVPLLCLSASLGNRSPKSYWHFSTHALRENSPVPIDMWTMLSWHSAVADKVPQRIDGEPLIKLWHEAEGETTLERAQYAYGQRFTSTPGIVASVGQRPSVGLEIEVVRHDPDPAVLECANHIISKREVPGDPAYPLVEDIEITQRLDQLELGFAFVWYPPPPPEWRAARKMWATIIGDVLAQKIPGLESPELIKDHLLATGSPYARYYHEWMAQHELYKPPTVPIWVSRKPLEAAEAWLQGRKHGIVWVPYPHIGLELAERTGLPYFRKGGVSHDGKHHIERWDGPCFASMRSCSVGLNLQYKQHENYHLGFDSVGERCEQLIGRTHREGQKKTVKCTIPIFTEARERAIRQAVIDAKGEERRSRVPKKLAYAEWRGYGE